MSLRREFVLKALACEVPFAELCREYDISRKTGYKWVARFKQTGTVGLADVTRRPGRSPLAISGDMTLEIVRLRELHPTWGPKKLWKVLSRVHHDRAPSMTTIARVLKRRGMIRGRKWRKRSPLVPDRAPVVEVNAPNDLWTVDFKGWWRADNGERCEPLTVRDAHSRFILCVRLLKSTATEGVRQAFEELFARYGVPKAIQSDNGTPFACVMALGGLTELSAWWVSLGVRLVRSRPGCPQDNGAHERMHSDMRLEIQEVGAATVRAQQAIVDKWVQEFNYVRPHEALDLRTPFDVYRPSNKKPAGVVVGGFPDGCALRRLGSSGHLEHRGRKVYVTRALRRHSVGLREVGAELWVYFYDLLLGKFVPGVDDKVQPFDYDTVHHVAPPNQAPNIQVSPPEVTPQPVENRPLLAPAADGAVTEG